jgi:hypothetical protein
VAAIHEDRFGALWIASSHGLTLVPSPADDRPWLIRYTTAHGLSGNDLTCLNSDQDGRIFVCTGSGVDQIEVIRSGPVPTLGRIRHYNTSDGLTRDGHYVAYRDKAPGACGLAAGTESLNLRPRPRRSPWLRS